jgi:hypothetical protein
VGSRRQHYRSYTISEYDSKADVVVLTKDGQRIRLALKQRKASSADAKIQPEVERAALNNLRQLAAAADQYYLELGKKATTCDESTHRRNGRPGVAGTR